MRLRTQAGSAAYALAGVIDWLSFLWRTGLHLRRHPLCRRITLPTLVAVAMCLATLLSTLRRLPRELLRRLHCRLPRRRLRRRARGL